MLAVPAAEQYGAQSVSLGSDGRVAGLDSMRGLFRGRSRLPVGAGETGQLVDRVRLERDQFPQRLAHRLVKGEPVPAALLGRPRRVQLGEDDVQRAGWGVAGGLGGG
jgi:hypothetical protein